MNKYTRLTFVFVSLLMIGGCATKAEFNHTPKDVSEFTKERSYLESHYSDIAKYDRTFAPPDDAPLFQDLEKIWGEPNKKQKRWWSFVSGFALSAGLISTWYLSYPWLAVIYIIGPYPQEEYTWQKGGYEVTAFGRSQVLTRYEDRIHSWGWKKIEGKEDSATIDKSAKN